MEKFLNKTVNRQADGLKNQINDLFLQLENNKFPNEKLLIEAEFIELYKNYKSNFYLYQIKKMEKILTK